MCRSAEIVVITIEVVWINLNLSQLFNDIIEPTLKPFQPLDLFYH